MTFHDVFRASEFVSEKSHGSRTRMKKSAIRCHGEHVFEACLASKRYKYNGSSSPSGCRKGRKSFFKCLGPCTCPDPGCQSLFIAFMAVNLRQLAIRQTLHRCIRRASRFPDLRRLSIRLRRGPPNAMYVICVYVSLIKSRNVAYVMVSDPFSLHHALIRAETCVGVRPGDRAFLQLASRSNKHS